MIRKNKILIIDDDTYICNLLEGFLNKNGFTAESSFTGQTGLKRLTKKKYDLVICDYRLPDSNGLKMLSLIKKNNPQIIVIIITAYTDIKMAVQLIKSGAYDYVAKPVYPEEILSKVRSALKTEIPNNKDEYFSDIFIKGNNRIIKKIYDQLKIVAPTDMSVLIEGETGSGKEYFARNIHFHSLRKDKPFIAIDCGAIPKELANSELFGHVKGSFTGAVRDKTGYFEKAHKGTIFLDEVGNLSYEVQVKLLRALNEKVITKTGDNRNIQVDIRIITATNENLKKALSENRFREDLYHRLNEFRVLIPPLRKRKDDIMLFADNFLKAANTELNKKVTGFSSEVRNKLLNYSWHGNLRELNNVIRRCVLLTQTDIITPDTLPEEIKLCQESSEINSMTKDKLKLKKASLEAEKEVIIKALYEAGNNKSLAAKILKIDRKTLYNKLKRLNINLEGH